MKRRDKPACPVRVTADTYERIQRLAQRAVRNGWNSLGAKREDLPTLAAIISEAVERLEERVA